MALSPDALPIAKITAQAAFDLAFAAASGAVLCSVWLDREPALALVRTTLRRLGVLCSIAMLITLPALLVLLTASMIASTQWPELRAALPDVAATEAGRTLLHTWVASCALLFALLWVRGRHANTVALTVLACVALVRTPLGHAASDGAYTLRELMQWLHLLAVNTWAGGVIVAGLLVVPRVGAAVSDAVLAFAHRLSKTVTVALLVTVLSGAYNTWRGTDGHLRSIAHSDWGSVLLAKLLFFFLALSLGARMHWMLRSRTTTAAYQVQRLLRGMRIEALAMLAILVLSAWLANTAPADEVTRTPATTTALSANYAIRSINSSTPLRGRMLMLGL